MPANLFGLPTHILLLHVVVVLLPLAAVATLCVTLSGRFRRRWGIATVVVTFPVTLFVPVTAQAGESLAARLPTSPAIAHHAALGNQVTVWTALFGICLFAVVALDLVRRSSPTESGLRPVESRLVRLLPVGSRGSMPRWAPAAFRTAQGLAVVTSIGVIVLVVLAGHSGAQAVWAHFPTLGPIGRGA